MNKLMYKSFLMMFLVVTISFTLYSPGVNAQSYGDLSGPIACCEQTKTDSPYNGESCRYTALEYCDESNGKEAEQLACEQTNYCESGVCVLNGECSSRVYKQDCVTRGGNWKAGTVDQVEECSVGCCALPSGSSLTTQSECRLKIEGTELRLQEIFDGEITDETTCSELSRGTEEGCCVQTNECSWGTRRTCNEKGGEFELNKICSWADLGCTVTEKFETSCEGDEVWWLDSAGNPENIYGVNYRQDGERVSKEEANAAIGKPDFTDQDFDIDNGNCNFALGSKCSDASAEFLRAVDDNNVNHMCLPLYCPDTTKFERTSWTGGRKENSESWCIYEGKVGEGLDLVGSEHYRAECINGREIIELVGNARDRICIGGKVQIPGFDQEIDGGIAVPNDYNKCIAANTIDITSCDLSKFSEDQQEIIEAGKCGGECNLAGDKTECCEKQACRQLSCEEANDCLWLGGADVGNPTNSDDATFAACVPAVPLGTNPPEESNCNLPNELEFTALWKKDNYLDDWDCKKNCQLFTKEFAQAWNQICYSQGDCGAYYNIEGKATMDGFDHTGSYGGHGKAAEGIEKNEILRSVGGTVEAIFRNNLISAGDKPLNGSRLFSNEGAFVSLYDVGIKRTQTERQHEITSVVNDIFFYASIGTLGIATALAIFTATATFSIASIGASIASVFVAGTVSAGPIGTAVAAVIAVAILVTAFFKYAGQKTSEVTYKIQCLPYQPPVGGDDCEACMDGSKYPYCTEYKCESLGQACEYESGDGKDGTCYWENENDYEDAIISNLPIAPLDRNDFEETLDPNGARGVKLKGLHDSYEPITIGIATDDYASCRISRFNDKSFEDMSEHIDNVRKKKNHTMEIPIAYEAINPDEDTIALVTSSTENKENKFYIKCRKPNGNTNTIPYVFTINVNKGKDTQPPIIEEFNIKNGAKIPFNMSEVDLTLFLNEPAKQFNGCKASRVDQSYNRMEINGTCSSTQVSGTNYFPCSMKLTELANNQENTFYMRCLDRSPNNNTNQQSTVYRLQGTPLLEISEAGPTGRVENTTIELTARTEKGADDGKSTCFYSQRAAYDTAGLIFQNTNDVVHSTLIPLANEEEYTMHIFCRDEAGNLADTSVEFYTTTPEIEIGDVSPTSKIKIYSSSFNISAKVAGGVSRDGDSQCRYVYLPGSQGSGSGILNEIVEQTDSYTEYQGTLGGLNDGTYMLNITCSDGYKKDSEEVEYEVLARANAGMQAVFTLGDRLTFVSTNEANCAYSVEDENFDFDTAVKGMESDSSNLIHELFIGENNVFYIRCKGLQTNQLGKLYTVNI